MYSPAIHIGEHHGRWFEILDHDPSQKERFENYFDYRILDDVLMFTSTVSIDTKSKYLKWLRGWKEYYRFISSVIKTIKRDIENVENIGLIDIVTDDDHPYRHCLYDFAYVDWKEYSDSRQATVSLLQGRLSAFRYHARLLMKSRGQAKNDAIIRQFM